jgi:urease accessory protein
MNLQVEKEKPDSWHGKLNLVYAHRQGKTQLIHSEGKAPLKVQRPFYPEGQEVCHSVILHTAGGIVGGDRLSLNVHLQPKSQALITTAAASKVYRSNGLQARQNIEIKVDAGACLEWLPQEAIAFDGAIYQQDLRVNLAINATFLGWEITRYGRSARGEKFLQGNWRSHTEIWQENKPLWIDRQWLPGNEEVFHSPHGLAGQPITGTLVWVGSSISTEIVEKAQLLWKPLHSDALLKSSVGNASHPLTGVTRLENGFLCRYRGASTTEVRNWFISVWQLLRKSCLSRDNCLPRVWQL